MGQLTGMLGILCQDPDRATQHSSLEGIGQLYQFLLHQKGEFLQIREDPNPKSTPKQP